MQVHTGNDEASKEMEEGGGEAILLGLAGFHEASLLDVGVIHSLGKVKSQALQSQ